MKKDHLTDYATNAFREYAAAGCPTYEQLRNKLLTNAALSSSGERLPVDQPHSVPTEAAVLAAEIRYDGAEGRLQDIYAVIRTIELLGKERDGELIIRCLKNVYFPEPTRPLKRREITERVLQTAVTEHIDERTVFRKLRDARKIFSTERGLNTSENKKFSESCQ